MPEKRRKQTTNANIGFEEKLWEAANALRNKIAAADYRKVVKLVSNCQY